MASTAPKEQQQDQLVVEEETGVFTRTVTQAPLPRNEKRKQVDETYSEPRAKSARTSNDSPSASTAQTTLSIPFWKQLAYRRSPQFQTREIGTFSLLTKSEEKECFDDKRYLRIYKYPLKTLDVHFDLKVGESDYTNNVQDKNINAMLWWITQHKNQIFKNDRFTFDFLSWRGVLRLIMCTLFEKHSDWLLAIIRYKNAYFLCEYITEKQIKNENEMTSEQRSFCYYGHKFEEYVTKNDSSEESINPSKQFTGVFESTIDSYRLLYGAEMDCIIEQTPQSSTEHIELKVCAGKSLDDLQFGHNRKFAKWWIQCFLVGIKKIVIGLRDNNGFVNKLAPMNISELEQATHTWNGASFFNFFLLFANFVKENVTSDYSLNHKDVVLFRFQPSSQKIIVEHSSDPKYHFLPDWFFKEFS